MVENFKFQLHHEFPQTRDLIKWMLLLLTATWPKIPSTMGVSLLFQFLIPQFKPHCIVKEPGSQFLDCQFDMIGFLQGTLPYCRHPPSICQ